MKKSLKQEMAAGYGLTDWRGNGLPEGYFPHWEYNVYGNFMEERFKRMFTNGSGSELDFKGAAIHSSSMFSYNFFHWINSDTTTSVELPDYDKPIKLSYVGFEARLKTLPSSNAPANIDVVLLSEDEEDLLLIESKLLEYNAHSAFDISNSYANCEKYYVRGEDWSEFIKSCRQKYVERGHYYEGLKQNICHLIAIQNLATKEEKAVKAKDWFREHNGELKKIDLSKIQRYHFINAVFDPNSKFEYERECFKDYKNLQEGFREELMNNNLIPENLTVSFMEYSHFWKQFKANMPEDIEAFLNRRYMQFGAAEE